MRFIIAAIIILIASPAWPQAQKFPIFTINVPAVYTGPGDVASGAQHFWGLRALNGAVAAAATPAMVNLSRSSDSQNCNFIPASNGGIGNSTACSGAFGSGTLTSFCTSTTCNVTRVFDQVANGKALIQSTAANQPTITLSDIGSFPGITCANASSTLLSTGAVLTSIGLPYSMIVTGRRTTNGGFNDFIAGNDATIIMGGTSTGNQWRWQVDGTHNVNVSNATDSSFHAFVGTANSTPTQNFYIDSLTSGTGANTGGSITNHNTCGLAAIGFVSGDILESGIWNVDISQNGAGSNQASMISNMRNYWGF